MGSKTMEVFGGTRTPDALVRQKHAQIGDVAAGAGGEAGFGDSIPLSVIEWPEIVTRSVGSTGMSAARSGVITRWIRFEPSKWIVRLANPKDADRSFHRVAGRGVP